MAENFSTTTENIPAADEVQLPGVATPWTAIRHPAVMTLTRRDRRLANFGLTMFVVSQAVPYFVLVNVRWMLAGGYIPPGINQWLGGLWPVLLLAVGIVFIAIGVDANNSGNTRRLQWTFSVSAVLGTAAIVLMMTALWMHPWNVLSLYGSIYAICQGVGAFYTLLAVIVTQGVVFRAGAGLVGPPTSFGPESAAVVWTFNAISWFGLYVALYLV